MPSLKSNPRIECAVGVIQDKQGRVLIGQRKRHDSWGGYWEFPGGKRKASETLEDCLIREICEEVGLKIKHIQFVFKVSTQFKNRDIDLNFYLCDWREGKAQPRACQQVQWVTKHELNQYQFPPANEAILEFLYKKTFIPANH